MAITKYTRTNFMTDQVVDGILEKDMVDNNWDLFEIKREMTFFTLSRSYTQRPDLLSLKLYGKVDYWWILAKVNNIDDWWNDIEIGDVIEVPDIRDIEDWSSAVKKRQNSR
jgi:hypothetical protein